MRQLWCVLLHSPNRRPPPFYLAHQDYKVIAQRETVDNLAHRVSSSPLPPNTWVHVTFVYTGRNVVLLINGVVVSMRTGPEAYSDQR